MQKIVLSFGIITYLFLFVTVAGAAAATLKFNPSTISTQQDGTFTVDVVVDAGTEQITGTDVWILYDPQYLELQTVTAGSFFPKTGEQPSTGKMYIYGVIENQGDYKSGTGVVSTLTFKTIKGGNTTVTYACDSASTESSKILKNDINATNIINCAGNGTLLVNSPATGTGTGTSTTTTVTTLPQSGVYENVLLYSVSGVMLMLIGAGLRLVIR